MSGEVLLDPYKDCPTFEVLITAGDETPEWAFAYQDTDVDANPVELVIERPTTTLVIPATVLDGPNGVGKFAFAPASFVSGPAQQCTVFVENTATSKRETLFKFFIDVNADPHP